MVDGLVSSILRGEADAKKDDKDKSPPDFDELQEIRKRWERAYLRDETNLDIIATWYSAGHQAPTLLEVSQWPATLRHDYTVFMSRLGTRRELNDSGEDDDA